MTADGGGRDGRDEFTGRNGEAADAANPIEAEAEGEAGRGTLKPGEPSTPLRDGGAAPLPGFAAKDMYWALAVYTVLSVLAGLVFRPLLGPDVIYKMAYLVLLGDLLVLLYLLGKLRRCSNGYADVGLKRARGVDWLVSFLVYGGFISAYRVGGMLYRHIAFDAGAIPAGFRLAASSDDAFSFIIRNSGSAPITAALLFLSLVVVTPVNEEILFRGIGLAGYVKTGGAFRAAFWVTLMFGAAHGASGFLHAFVFGFALAIIRLRSGSLYCSIGVHAVNNALSLLFLYLRQ